MNDYTENKVYYRIDELQELSSLELEEYASHIYRLILEDPTNCKLFEYVNNIYKFWISKDNNETAYHMYLDMLNLTNHYYEAYEVCKVLLNENRFEPIVYQQLTDFGYVLDGVFSFDEHLDYIRKYLSVSENIEEKEQYLSLLKYEENLWK